MSSLIAVRTRLRLGSVRVPEVVAFAFVAAYGGFFSFLSILSAVMTP